MLKASLRVCGECTHEHAAGKAYFFEHGAQKKYVPSMAARHAAVIERGFLMKPQSD